MATFINVEGTFINLDNVADVIWSPNINGGQLLICFNAADSQVEGEFLSRAYPDTPTVRAAYEWLKSTCVMTFPQPEVKPIDFNREDELPFACPRCGKNYVDSARLKLHIHMEHTS